MKKNRLFFWVLLALLALLALAACFAPVLSPHDPNETSLSHALLSPSAQYPLGTDQLGRCMLSRILYGARLSLFSAVTVTVFVFLFGTVVGVCAGYFGGIVDGLLHPAITMVQSFPKLILAMAIAALLGIGIENMILALCLVGWVEYARLSRSFTQALRQQTFLQAARLCGESHGRIIVCRIIPNLLPPLLVQASLGIAGVILEIAALSYLGFGVEEPLAEWGAMISQGRGEMQTHVMLIVYPAVALFLTAALFQLLGEAGRDIIEES